jgi:hypothetical protein
MSNTRVRAADGTMTTVYVICISPAVVLGTARRERTRVFRRKTFSTRRNFFPTCIRQRHGFYGLGLGRESLLAAVLSARFAEASLVARAGGAMIGGRATIAAHVVAVVLPVVVRAADVKRHDAPEARQLVNRNARAHQALGATARNLEVAQNRETDALSKPGSGSRPKARA